MYRPRQLFFQCGAEMPKGWTPLLGHDLKKTQGQGPFDPLIYLCDTVGQLGRRAPRYLLGVTGPH